jgi:hypothetical protein
MLFLHGTCAVAVLLLTCTIKADEVVQLSVPKSPPFGTQILSGSFQGYSMEMASFPSIAGNVS